ECGKYSTISYVICLCLFDLTYTSYSTPNQHGKTAKQVKNTTFLNYCSLLNPKPLTNIARTCVARGPGCESSLKGAIFITTKKNKRMNFRVKNSVMR
ncbi:hypothetical protein HI914_06054, partial [Erysiphe necator]